jgi:hypothetical protein
MSRFNLGDTVKVVADTVRTDTIDMVGIVVTVFDNSSNSEIIGVVFPGWADGHGQWIGEHHLATTTNCRNFLPHMLEVVESSSAFSPHWRVIQRIKLIDSRRKNLGYTW